MTRYNCYELPWTKVDDMIILCRACGQLDYMVTHIEPITLGDYEELNANLGRHIRHRTLGCIADDIFVSRCISSL